MPIKPGKVERCEFEYVRHGTQTLIAYFDVVTGKVGGTIANTRTEADFVSFLDGLLRTEAPAMRWRIVCDNLDTHRSEGVVRLVARQCGSMKQRSAAKGTTTSWGRDKSCPKSCAKPNKA